MRIKETLPMMEKMAEMRRSKGNNRKARVLSS